MHEPNARGPPASKTWYLKSQEYVRPAFNNWKQMAGFSEQRRANERHAFRLSKREDYMEMRKQKGHIWRYCKICSESKAHTEPTAIAHQHFSTLIDRCNADLDGFGMFECTNCKDNNHYAVQANRYPLLVTSSFLNAWRAPYQSGSDQYEGDLIHPDEICIPGGKIEDLHHAFKSEYAKFKRPVDVLLAAGLNNFKREEPDVIMAKIRAFKATVVNRRDGSTFAVCTLPFAPKLVDIRPKRKNQFWNLGPKTRRMFVLNELIKAENRMPAEFSKIVQPKKCQNAPRFHTWGLMSDKTATREHERPGSWFYRISGYRLNDWREPKIEAKLHFCDRVRLRAGKAVMSYFLSLYELTEQAQIEQDQPEYPTDTDNTEGSVTTESSESTSDIYSTTSSSSTGTSSSTSSKSSSIDSTSTSNSSSSDSSSTNNPASSTTSGSSGIEAGSLESLTLNVRCIEPERTNFTLIAYNKEEDTFTYVGPLH